jgi:FRG domain
MAEIFRASDVRDAVMLATRLLEEERYDWFRGQVKNYRLLASLHRLADADKEDAIQKVARFESWINRTPGLEEVAAGGTDAILAVAQHYGLPTPFVDFTTDPEIAGFFASDAADLVLGETSCIICLNTQDLARFWETMPPRFPPPECLSIDVSNLWRLQAQNGVFLFCPYANIEDAYDFDRILFPATRGASGAMRERMYPRRKSQLEILLDQYFMNERLIEGNRFIKSMNWNMSVVDLDKSNPEVLHSDAVDPRIPALLSWGKETLSRWRSTYDERLAVVQRGYIVRFRINPDADPQVIASQVRTDVAARIASGDASRATLVDWRIDLDADDSDQGHAATLEAALNWLWDGLRTLPHSDEDLATGMGNCAGISLAHRSTSRDNTWADDWEGAVEAVLGPAVKIGLDGSDGSYSYCYAAEDSVSACIRGDIKDYLTPRFRNHLLTHPAGMLQVLPLPDRLFEFDRLSQLMARELSPTQVLMRPGRSVFFSPARITRMGLS